MDGATTMYACTTCMDGATIYVHVCDHLMDGVGVRGAYNNIRSLRWGYDARVYEAYQCTRWGSPTSYREWEVRVSAAVEGFLSRFHGKQAPQ